MTARTLPAAAEGLAARHRWATLALCLALGALVSVLLGQDTNWDLLNYHLYNPWAWLHGRRALDLAAAGPQTYFNPLLDVPYYVLATGPLAHWPRLLAAVQGLWYGALVFIVWRLVALLARAQARAFDWGDAFAVLVGVTGSAVIAQVGTTFNEVPLAAMVLGALYLVLAEVTTTAPRAVRAGRILVAGALAGLAAGLKLTAIIYLPPLGLLLLLFAPRGRRWRLAVTFALAAGVAFLVAYGWWAAWLYRTTGSPMFPMFNNLFHSDWIAATNGTDGRFRPHGPKQWLFYPFYWALHRVGLVTEPRMLDGRFAFAWLAGVAIVVHGAFQRQQHRDHPDQPLPDHAGEAPVLLFVAVAYVIWLVLFSILRYAIPIEALTGLLVVMALRRLFGTDTAAATVGRRRAMLAAASVLSLLLVTSTHRPDWGRVAYGKQVFQVDAPTLPDHSLVLFVDQPHTYLAAFIGGHDLRFVGATWFTGAAKGHRLWEMTQQRIAAQRGPIYAVLGPDGDPNSQRGLLPKLGLALAPPCRPVASNLEPQPPDADPSSGLRLCPLTRIGD